jgi:hypothetical protein
MGGSASFEDGLSDFFAREFDAEGDGGRVFGSSDGGLGFRGEDGGVVGEG